MTLCPPIALALSAQRRYAVARFTPAAAGQACSAKVIRMPTAHRPTVGQLAVRVLAARTTQVPPHAGHRSVWQLGPFTLAFVP